MLKAGWDVFSRMTVETPMKGYNDLDILRELPVELYLVTSGFRRLQESKIKALNLEHLFTGTHVDAIDEVERKGKQGIFESGIDAKQLRPEEVIVVGFNPIRDRSGNRLE
jgi:putative hydrolase of the HAD superfamily